jgi:hypothetical protein
MNPRLSALPITQQFPSPHVPFNSVPKLVFPISGYVGVVGEFAELYSHHYEAPKEFLYFDLLALLGTLVSGRARVDVGHVSSQPRLYLLKIAPSGIARKSTSHKIARRFLERALEKLPKFAPGFEDTAPFKIVDGVGSGEGIAKALSKNNRILVHFDEFRRFEQKAGIQGSALLQIVNELFDSNVYGNWTKNSAVDLEDAHLGIVANTTEESFRNMLNGGEMWDIGLFNRLFLLPGATTARIALPEEPSPEIVNPLVQRMAAHLMKIPGLQGVADNNAQASDELKIRLTEGARRLWVAWYENNLRIGEETTRLDNIGLRLVALFAISLGTIEVDEKLVETVLEVVKYQEQVRAHFKPLKGETPEARMEESVLVQLQKRGALTKSELRQFTNANRVGSTIYNKALQNLSDSGRVRSIEFTSPAGKKVNKYVLGDHSLEDSREEYGMTLMQP